MWRNKALRLACRPTSCRRSTWALNFSLHCSPLTPVHPWLPVQSTFAMLNWALRETVTKLLFGKPMLPGPGFYALSYALLAIIYLVAILVPSGERAPLGWSVASGQQEGSRTAQRSMNTDSTAAAAALQAASRWHLTRRLLPTTPCSVDRHVCDGRHGRNVYRVHLAGVIDVFVFGTMRWCMRAHTLSWGSCGSARTCICCA